MAKESEELEGHMEILETVIESHEPYWNLEICGPWSDQC